jgi:2'-5' RNA ligase
MSDVLRLFFGFGLSERDRALVGELQRALRDELSVGGGVRRSGKVRWVSPGDFHLTLRFIGGVPTSQLAHYVRALEVLSRFAPASVYVDGVIGFPSARHARTLVLGLRDPEQRLRAMAARLEPELAALGLASEDRPLVPHVTLARVSPALDINGVGSECVHHDTEVMLTELCLFASRKQGQGSRYVPLHAYALTGDVTER